MVGIIISLIVVFTYFNLCVLPSDGQTDRQAVWEKWSLIQACDPWISLFNALGSDLIIWMLKVMHIFTVVVYCQRSCEAVT